MDPETLLGPVLDTAPTGTLTAQLAWVRKIAERAIVARALRTHHTRARAAEALGIPLQALSRTLRRHPALAAQYPAARGGASTRPNPVT